MKDEWGEKFFDGICPYTDKPCDDWMCKECKVEERGRYTTAEQRMKTLSQKFKQDGMYYKVTQEYLHFNAQKRQLMQDRDKIDARLEVIEGVLIDLNDILCKHGNHIYEHFEESEPRESEETIG